MYMFIKYWYTMTTANMIKMNSCWQWSQFYFLRSSNVWQITSTANPNCWSLAVCSKHVYSVWRDIFIGDWPSWDRYLVYVCSQNLYSGADLSKRHAANWDSIWLRVELCCSDCPALNILLACIPSLKQNFNRIPNKLKCKVNYSAMLVHVYKHVYSASELAMLLLNFNYSIIPLKNRTF